MSGSNGDQEAPLRDHHFYNEDAYQLIQEDGIECDRIDVNNLIGANGTRLVPNDEDLWFRRQDQRAHSEPNSVLLGEVYNLYSCAEADASHDDYLDQDYLGARRDFELGAADILQRLAARLAPLAADVFKDRLDQLTEPVRSVGIACLMLHMRREAVARRLQTSVETVDFLVEVALSHLEPLVEFRSPRPMPPHWHHRTPDSPGSQAE